MKNGYLIVADEYQDKTIDDEQTLQSVTKSIASTFIGVAIQNGFIENTDQKILDFFPEYESIDNLDENKKAMTLHHALTMRTGQAWTGESHLDGLNRFRGDRMKYVLDYQMEMEPGKKWYYNSGIAVLLGGLLENATDMDLQVFSKRYLFEPMGIKSDRWMSNHNGIPHTGGGLYLSPVDMAKIGYLYLKKGRWKDRQLLPESYINVATTIHVPETEHLSGVKKIGYGYLWWLLPDDKNDTSYNVPSIYMAIGHWGQYIFVIPKHDMVVVFTNDWTATYEDENRPISFMYEYVIPSIKE